MDKGNWKDIRDVFLTLDTIEKKNQELSGIIKQMEVPQRIPILNSIYQDILKRSPLFSNTGVKKQKQKEFRASDESPTVVNVVDSLIQNIEKDPTKKVIHLKEFLDFFQEISEKDKNVILQSLKDLKIEKLKEKMVKLTNIFNLDL